jgi:hypothetical protein
MTESRYQVLNRNRVSIVELDRGRFWDLQRVSATQNKLTLDQFSTAWVTLRDDIQTAVARVYHVSK